MYLTAITTDAMQIVLAHLTADIEQIVQLYLEISLPFTFIKKQY